MNKDFKEWFFQEWKKTEGLIHQSDAARIIGVKRQSITNMLEDGRLKKYEFEGLSPYVSIKDISLLILKRNGKSSKTSLSDDSKGIPEQNTKP